MVKKKTNKLERKLEKELLWIIGFGVFLILLFFVVSNIFKSLNKFDYEGLPFTIERFDKLKVYHHYYYFKDAQGKLNLYNLYLRYDPRENAVPVEGGRIRFPGGATYVTLDTGTNLTECLRSSMAIGDLAVFLADNKIAASLGNMNKSEAKYLNQTFVTCETNPKDSVIEIFRGNETNIKIKSKCMKISVGPSCDIFEAVEKFKLRAVIDAKN